MADVREFVGNISTDRQSKEFHPITEKALKSAEQTTTKSLLDFPIANPKVQKPEKNIPKNKRFFRP